MVLLFPPINSPDPKQQLSYVYYGRQIPTRWKKLQTSRFVDFQKILFLTGFWLFPFTFHKIIKKLFLLPQKMFGTSYGRDVATNH